MAKSTECAKETSWFRGLGSARAAAKAKDADGRTRPEDVLEEPRQSCAFDFAELLEQGRGPGPTSSYAKPPMDPAETQRLMVHRSESGQEYRLATEAGRPLLLARREAEGNRYDIFAARSSEEMGPAFRLTSSPSREFWSLHSTRCECCEARGRRQCGSREVARMAHYREVVGKGQALCMDLELPALDAAGESEVVCSVCGDSPDGGVLELSSRRPRWNARHRSLTLDFGGRCSMASAKNFQLETLERPGEVKLLFGQVGEHQFVLDHKYPLGTVQAFAAALSASHWK